MAGIEEGLGVFYFDIAGRVVNMVHIAKDELQWRSLGPDDQVNPCQVGFKFFLHLGIKQEQKEIRPTPRANKIRLSAKLSGSETGF